MDLHQVAIPVTDLDRAIGFYRALIGVEPIAVFDPPGLAFFPLTGTRLMLDRSGPVGALVYLRVDDVGATLAILRDTGAEIVQEPHVIFADTDGLFGPAGQDEWLAFARDSEGNLLGLVTRTDQPAR